MHGSTERVDIQVMIRTLGDGTKPTHATLLMKKEKKSFEFGSLPNFVWMTRQSRLHFQNAELACHIVAVEKV